MEFIKQLFSSGDFMPHGGCYLWTWPLVWLHVVSDALIGLAYFSIPITLAWFVRRRRDVDFRWMFLCFAVFILACGTTHGMEIWNVWHAHYWIAGGVKAITAAASVVTAILLIRLIPRALALPSPAMMAKLNQVLEEEVDMRRRAQDGLFQANRELEKRVAERTAELTAANERLAASAEAKRREDAARLASEARYRTLFEYAPDGIVIADPASRYLDANPSICRMLGYTRGEFIGLHASDIVMESESPQIAHALDEIKAGDDHQRSWQFRRKDGSTFEAEVTATMMPDGNLLGVIRDITERRKGEAAAARLAAIVESSSDAIVGKDLHSRVTSWNAGAERMFGYAADEMVGQSITQLIPPDRQEDEDRILSRIRRGEVVEPFETQRLRKDGTLLDVSVTVSPIKNAQGEVIGASKVARDITARNRAEEQLRASFKEIIDLKAALDEHAIVAITDPQGRITYVNDKFCAISMYSREELLGQDHRLINSGFHSKEFIRGLWTTIAHGRVWHGEIKNKAKDGSFYWVDTTIVPFLNEQGKPRQYVAIRADITARKNAELALREKEVQLHASDRRLAEIVHGMTEACFALGADWRFTFVNDRGESLLRHTREEMLGRPIWEVFHRLVGTPMEKHYRRAMAERVPMSFEAYSPIAERWLDIRLFPTGEGLAAFLLDIDARREAEASVQLLNAELEQRVIQRTIQLEAANKELEAFSYSVSHDLRAPLRAIDGFSLAVLEDFGAQLPADGQEYLQTIRQSAQQMGALIDDLLTFSRLSRSPLRGRTIHMDQLVDTVLDDLRPQQAGRKVEILRSPLPAGWGDPALLKQVWVNLLSNALKYTLKRPAAVVEIGSRVENGENVYFVRDNGTGFDMRYAGKLFGVFQRLHRADEFEGTGVGLAIVQRIVQRHGGRVWAEAKVDRGATFSFTLAAEDAA